MIGGDIVAEVVRIKNMTCAVGNHALLSSINWSVKENEQWVVFGRNGSGKTTLLSIIAGFRKFTDGTVKVFGEEYTAQNILAIRKKIGWVSSSFFDKYYRNESVMDIVLSGLSGKLGVHALADNQERKKARQLLIELGLEKQIHYTYDLLSKGERQNVLIARALINDPKLLILDEPMTGLDLLAREALLERMRKWANHPEMTMIYVTHYTEEIIDIFDKCLLLQDGKIYAQGNTKDLFEEDIFAAFLSNDIEMQKINNRYYVSIDQG